MNANVPLPIQPIQAAPYAHDKSSVSRIMFQVCLALVPATVFGFYLFGWPAFHLWAITIISAYTTEYLCIKMLGDRTARLTDNSALLTAWLLAVSMPPWAPWWLAVGGGAFAIALGKQIYGGIGSNPFNPAMLARCALLICFPVQMTTWITPQPIFAAQSPGFLEGLAIILGLHATPDTMTGATALGQLKTALTMQQHTTDVLAANFSLKDAITGITSGSLGETSVLFVLAGGLWMLYKRLITWHVPVSMLATTAITAGILHAFNPERYGGALYHLTSGGILLGAFFIATDPVTSPASKQGKLVFGAGCGLVSIIIRVWGGFPEGVAFAVCFMNTLTPLIDRWMKPRIFGRTLRGEPLPIPSSIRGPKV